MRCDPNMRGVSNAQLVGKAIVAKMLARIRLQKGPDGFLHVCRISDGPHSRQKPPVVYRFEILAPVAVMRLPQRLGALCASANYVQETFSPVRATLLWARL